MSIFKCKMCGGSLEINGSETVATCEYCGTTQTVPTSKDENLQGLFNRANILRMKSEFDKAEQLYEKVIEKDETQAEAYWGLILCKYGIEYVEDPATFKRVPTCHRTSFDSIIADEDYKSALSFADSVQRGIYEEEAKEIDRLQKEILELSQKEEPYDVFICYKEADEYGKRTQDSVIANDIYHQLTQEGLKVFYAAITLENKLGSAYEPCIFAALNSAKVMLSIGTKPEYFNAVWVKNEWSRFLKLIQKDRSKLLIPCYRDMDAYELPEEFAHLQAQDMSKIGFINDVVRGIKKIVTPEVKETPIQQTQIIENANGNVKALLDRGFMALEDGEWQKADDFFEQVLNFDAKLAEAYLGKLMAELRIKKQEDLKNVNKPFDDNVNYNKAIRFGSEKLKNQLEEYIIHIKEKMEEQLKFNLYNKAVNMLEKGRVFSAIPVLKKIVGYKDTETLLDQAINCSKSYIQLVAIKSNDKWGFINEKGEMVIKPQFDGTLGFDENGLATVELNGKWGFINEKGEMVIKPQFDEAYYFDENGLAVVKIKGKYGYINETGDMVIKPQFDYASYFSENGLAAVELNGKYGFINETGEMVIKPQFDYAEVFGENSLACVRLNSKYGYINEKGDIVIKPQFDHAGDFAENGLAVVNLNGKWGYINEIGDMVIKPQFDHARDFAENGLASVELNEKDGYINEKGEMVIKPQFDYAEDFAENGLANVGLNEKDGYINEIGEMVIKPQFDDADDFSVISKKSIDKRNERCKIIQQKSIYRDNCVCQHCGGTFKGLFSKTCTQCGRKKDY
ncbi:MAG: TIR domain-containing protein [Ruminococcaceae bacterium]|nr:TIR domain-containing protein [Oscillospiraceae bacterium]